MPSVFEVINVAKDLANRGVGVDKDGVYGTQCVDLPAYIVKRFFGKDLWGNAIDLLNSAKGLGFQVIYDAPGVNPKAGDIFVMRVSGHGYGHTGLVIEDSDGYTIKSIEQNVDGNADSLSVGGPARYVTRNFNGIIGWFRPPYASTIQQSTNNSADVPSVLANLKGEKNMYFSFNIKGDPAWNPGTIYLYNGAVNEIQGFHNSEEFKWFRAVYKDEYGKDLKHYDWANNVPVYVRVFGVLRPKRTV